MVKYCWALRKYIYHIVLAIQEFRTVTSFRWKVSSSLPFSRQLLHNYLHGNVWSLPLGHKIDILSSIKLQKCIIKAIHALEFQKNWYDSYRRTKVLKLTHGKQSFNLPYYCSRWHWKITLKQTAADWPRNTSW